jgi:hypothetical protein
MTKRKAAIILVCGIVMILSACTKASKPQIVVEIPAGFNGNFLLDMGAKSAPALPMENGSYMIVVPPDGKVTTSTILEKPKVTFKNASEGSVWGYSQQVFTTGDGISIGGKIEFFVGTKTQFDAEQNKKKHSGAANLPQELEVFS